MTVTKVLMGKLDKGLPAVAAEKGCVLSSAWALWETDRLLRMMLETVDVLDRWFWYKLSTCQVSVVPLTRVSLCPPDRITIGPPPLTPAFFPSLLSYIATVTKHRGTDACMSHTLHMLPPAVPSPPWPPPM